MKTEKFNPLVSIIIPVYNGSNFVRGAIDSALAQTYENIEIIVVNDGSTDNTEEILKSYGSKIRYYNKTNGGTATALNFAIEKSKGEYISWLSHDDLYVPDKVKIQVSALENQPKESIVFCDYKIIDANGNFLGDANLNEKAASSILAFLALDVKAGLHGCCLLIPKLAIDQAGGFDAKLEATQDYDLWFKLGKTCPFIHVKQQLVFYRKHPDQDTNTKQKQVAIEADIIQARLINSLTNEDVGKYIEDLNYYIETYHNYGGLKKTARSMLQLFCRCEKFNNQEIQHLINEELFQLDDPKSISTNIENINALAAIPKEKPRIIIYSLMWSKGGLERAISLLSKELSSKYQIIIISKFDLTGGYPLDKRILTIKFNPKNDYVSKLADLVCMFETDIFIGNPNYLVEFLNIYELLRKEGVKTIALNHENYFLPLLGRYFYPLWKKRKEVFKLANCVAWPMKLSAFLNEISISDNVAYIPNPSTFEAPKELLEKNPNNKIIIVGKFDKDLHISTENNKTIGEMMQRLQFTDNQIRIVGETDDIQAYYGDASVLIMTSETEGFGMVLLEAHAHGLPTVVFQIPGIEDVVQDGVNGFIVPQGDVELMAEKVDLLLRDEHLYKKFSINAQKNIDQFSLRKVSQRWINLIDMLLKTDDQQEINAILSKDFSPSVDGKTQDLLATIPVYEKLIDKLLDEQLLQSNSSGPSQVQPSMPVHVSKTNRIKEWLIKIIRRILLCTPGFRKMQTLEDLIFANQARMEKQMENLTNIINSKI